jgi:hypothetical protein
MPQQDNYTGKLQHSEEVGSVVFVSHDQPSEVLQPRVEAFHFPSSMVPPQAAAVLGGRLFAADLMRGDQLHTLLSQALVRRIAVVCFVTDQTFRSRYGESLLKRRIDQGYLVRRSAGQVDGERKTIAVCNGHDLAALAPLGFSNTFAPFLAGANEPSIKVSDRSSCPRSRRSSAKAWSICRKAPCRTQTWNRRWQVWYGGYRGGKSFQGAPVRNTQSMPLSTSRAWRGGRPRPEGLRLGGGIRCSTRSHCSFVRSMLGLSSSPTLFNHYF